MARPRKGKGGRVTPKGTRPMRWEGGPAAVSPLAPGLDELLPRFEDDLAVFRDAEASSFVSMFAAEPTPSNVIDLREPDDEPPSAREVLAVLADLGPRPPQRVVDTVAAFATYGGSAANKARKTLRALPSQPSPSAATFGGGIVTSTIVVEDLFGETTQYLFEISYPDNTVGAIAVLIDQLQGGILKDTVVMPDAATFTDLVDGTDEVTYRPGDPGQAAAAVDEAYITNDRTLSVEAIAEDEAFAMRPMVEKLLEPIQRQPMERAEVTVEARDEIVDEFIAWTRDTHPGASADVLSWSRLAVDFAVDYGHGHPLKWAPNSILSFLEWSTRKVMADPDELRQIPEMAKIFVPWAHTKAGWGDRYLPEALEAIDHATPLFEEAISGSAARSPAQEVLREALAGVDFSDSSAVAAAIEHYNLGLENSGGAIGPVGGTHPEPFDPSGLGAASDKAATIAELASAAGRAIFDDEYVTLVRRLTADVAREHPQLFSRGRTDIWASGVVYALAQLNGIIGGYGPMTLFADDLTSRLAGAGGTITAKASTIRGAVDAEPWSPNPRYQHSKARFGTDFRIDFGADNGPLAGHLEDYDPPPPLLAYGRLPARTAFVLRCELVDLPVSRTVLVPAAQTLFELHQVLQQAFDWLDYHLHQFTVDGHCYTSAPDPDWAPMGEEDRDDATVRLDELLRPGSVFEYLYDFGDNWEVRIGVEDVLEPESGRPPIDLLAGSGDAPPEDCGGTWGYNNLLAALKDPNHPEHGELREWAGDFEPGSFDLAAAAMRLRGG